MSPTLTTVFIISLIIIFLSFVKLGTFSFPTVFQRKSDGERTILDGVRGNGDRAAKGIIDSMRKMFLGESPTLRKIWKNHAYMSLRMNGHPEEGLHNYLPSILEKDSVIFPCSKSVIWQECLSD